MSDTTGDPALAEEQAHLDRTWAAYETLLAYLGGTRTLGIDAFAEESIAKMRQERLRAYTANSGPLYFGRIDEAGGERRYVGRHAITDADNELLAVNWRAPAAEPFYAATPQDPRGVRTRRRLEIDDRAVRGFVDEPLSDGAGAGVLTDAIVEDITRRRVGEMRQIVSTITPEQYGLISEATEGALIIQGGPGTGKTAVGLHRAAWLLYADPALARAGVLVVGPNEVFIAYISQVLPSLGESSVEQRAIESLATTRVARGAEPPALATLKGSGRMATVLERMLWARVGPPAEPVRVAVGRQAVVVEPEDVARQIAVAREQTRSHRAGRERFRARMADWVVTRLLEAARDPELLGTAELARGVKADKGFARLLTQAWPAVKAEALVASLTKGRPRLAAAVADGLLSGAELDLLLASAPAKDALPGVSDVPLLDEAAWLIDPEVRTYGHVVVDEAQNLTPMQLRMTVRRARRQSMTILGDIAQRTSDAELAAWDTVAEAAGLTRLRIADLLVSYRVPDDFLRLAAGYVPDGAVRPTGVREAAWPAVAVQTAEDELARVVALVAGVLRDAVGSVGVVVAAVHAEAVRTALGLGPGGRAEGAGLSGAVDVLDLRTAKGLEFDATVVVAPDAILAERPDGGPGGLYTALTRSTQALALVHAAPLPPELDGAAGLARLAPGALAGHFTR